MNELSIFNALFGDGCDFPVIKTSSAFSPKVDARETKSSYILEMDLPGFTENDVEIGLKDDVLKISSIKKTDENKKSEEEKASQDFQWLIHERKSAEFERSFSLPRDIDGENISATFKNGVLTITIPRKEEAGARKINICVA